jgi:REP element-mobilizing transposase RayT
MPFDPRTHHRRSIRLPGWDYRSGGAYFVTVCTHRREFIFAERDLRTVLERTWRAIGKYSHGARGDDFVVMPNHVHGIIWLPSRRSLVPEPGVGAQHVRSRASAGQVKPNAEFERHQTRERAAPLRLDDRPHPIVARGSLGAIVRAFKSAAAKRINTLRGTPRAKVWQRGYYERIIRNERELLRVREYIRDNPAKWAEDPNNPAVYARVTSTVVAAASSAKRALTAPPP